MTTVRARELLRKEIRDFVKKPVGQAKFVKGALAAIAQLARQARHEDKDVWPLLTAYVDPADKDLTGSVIKSGFRAFVLRRQGGRCCYCRCWLPGAGGARPIEHVLSRDEFGRFSMHFWNLAVVCADCNHGKTNKTWGFAKGLRTYPLSSAFQDTFHPRFHRYDEHVRYVMVETNQGAISMYLGLTRQGRHLCKEVLEKTAAKRALLNNHPQLQASLATIEGYRKVVGALPVPALDAFADMLEARLLKLVQK